MVTIDDSLTPSAEALRRRGGEKWERYPDNVLPAFVADMDFGVPPAVQDAIQSVVERESYGYPWLPDERGVAAAFARRMERRFGWQVGVERVRVTTDVVQGVAASVLAFSEPGDGVVVQTPAYPPLLKVVPRLGRRLVENPLADDGRRFVLDVEGLRHAVDAGTRIVLFCQPHNPTGRVFDEAELAAFRELVIERGLVVVSDEIHADLVFPPLAHTPLGALDEELARMVITLNSGTKSFNFAGLRCAVAHFGSDDLLQRFDRAAPFELLGQVTTMSARATIAAWDEGDAWLGDVRHLLESNRAMLLDWIERKLPGARCYLPEATYLAWIDCRELTLPGDPLAFFLEHAKVALKGGLDFGPPGEQFVRMNFATPPAVLQVILQRMSDAVQRYAR